MHAKGWAWSVVIGSSWLVACVGPGPIASTDGATTTTMSTSITLGTESGDSLTTTTVTDPDPTDRTDSGFPDLDGGWEPPDPCLDCDRLDVLIVVDNSGTMGEEQHALATNIDALIAMLDDPSTGEWTDVNIMVTSTDMGHPLCTPFEPEGYVPLQGTPQQLACIDRLSDFDGLANNPFPQACTDACPVAVAPVDPFLHYSGEMHSTTNVPGNNIIGALGCMIPQGLVGCGYEAPLEAMLQAINPTAPWNEGPTPFVRPEGALAIILLTDEYDCSVRPPDGYAYFVDPAQNTYWEVDPDAGIKTQATSAVCWNAGVDCGAPDANGFYADCTSIDTGVLHPLERYTQYLNYELAELANKPVLMLGIVGVPQSGVGDLIYHQWNDAPYPAGEILPGEPDGAHQEFEHGIGPGCTGTDGMGGFTGQAMPPVRMREVCESLNQVDSVRCCLSSVCAEDDYAGAFACLGGMLGSLAM